VSRATSGPKRPETIDSSFAGDIIILKGAYEVGGQVCALEGCHSANLVRSIMYRHVTSVLFSCHSKIYPAFRNPGLFKNVVPRVIRLGIAKSEVPDKSGN